MLIRVFTVVLVVLLGGTAAVAGQEVSPTPDVPCAVEPRAGQRQELADSSRQPRQIPAAADVGKQPDRRLGHGETAMLGGDAPAARLRNADAAAHGDAVHEGDDRLHIGEEEVVEPIFLVKERARVRSTRMRARPRESVVREKPARSHPSKGDQSAFVSIVDGLTRMVLVGWMIAMSASAPTTMSPLRVRNLMEPAVGSTANVLADALNGDVGRLSSEVAELLPKSNLLLDGGSSKDSGMDLWRMCQGRRAKRWLFPRATQMRLPHT